MAPANAAAKPCVSCHTGVTYLLARPALRKALGENTPTVYETGLLASLRSRVDQKEPAAAQGLGVESILAARFLATADAMAIPAKDHGRPEAQELIAYLHREQAAETERQKATDRESADGPVYDSQGRVGALWWRSCSR